MKYAGMPAAMRAIFAASFRRQLTAVPVYGEAAALGIMFLVLSQVCQYGAELHGETTPQ